MPRPVSVNLGLSQFPQVGIDVVYSIREMNGPRYGSLTADASPVYSTDVGEEFFAPKPEHFSGTGVGGDDYTTLFTNSQVFDARTAILFEFNNPVTEFGLYIGDAESRPIGVLTELLLFDSEDVLLNPDETSLVPTGVLVGDDAGTYDVFAPQGEGDHPLSQWGNQTTQYVGFHDVAPVTRMLIVVGDNDAGDTGNFEHLVFFGGTAVGSYAIGDFNRDSNVDGTDFLEWQRQFGAVGITPFSDADATGDGNVDGADLTSWEAQFGSNARLRSLVAVPEPSAIILASLLLPVIGEIRRTRRQG